MTKPRRHLARPISGIWELAHPKLKEGRKYFGAYPCGFPERARFILGASIKDPVLHVCGGMAKWYLYDGGFGPNDVTMDINPDVEPDFLQDVRSEWPMRPETGFEWKHILIDPPYSPSEAAKYSYRVGDELFVKTCAAIYPKPFLLLQRAAEVLEIGGRVGMLHWVESKAPAGLVLRAHFGIQVGTHTRIRTFCVYERV